MSNDTARAVRAARAGGRLSQGELARRSGLTAASISLLERGKRDPQLSTLRRIVRATGGTFVVSGDSFLWVGPR